MDKDISFGDVPAPGAPLQPKIAEENQRILEAELRERAELLKPKLSLTQIKKVMKPYKQLHAKLNKAGYNQLVMARWNIHQQYQSLAHKIQAAKDKNRAEIAAEGRAIAAEGRKINAEIEKLKPLADEFEAVCRKIRAHKRAIAYEKEDAENREAFKREARVWEAQMKAVFAQSPRLHHKWIDKNGNSRINTPKIRRILFQEDRVLYQIRTTWQGAIAKFFGRWASALPYGVDVSALTSEETLLNLGAALDRVVSVVWSKTGRSFFYAVSRLDSPDGIPARVPFYKVLPHYPAKDHWKTPWAAGVGSNRKIEFFNFEEYHHVLIAGASGGGKSNHINQMIATLVTMNKPSELKIVLIDNKGGIEFSHWNGIKHALFPMVKQAVDVPKVLLKVRQIMEDRLSAFEQIKAKNLESFNKKVAENEKLPRILLFLDEMATLIGLGDLTTEIHTLLRVLASQGRAVGINMVLCTQHPSVDTLPGWVKTNMNLRICGAMPNHTSSMIVIDSVNAASLPDIPGRLIIRRGGFEVTVQSPFITDDDIAEAVRISMDAPAYDLAELPATIEVAENTEDEAPAAIEVVAARRTQRIRLKFDREALLDLTLEQLGGKISAKNTSDIIPKETATLSTIRKMVDSLLSDAEKNEWILVHRGKTYELKKTKGRGSYVMCEVKSDAGISDIADTSEDVTLSHSSDEPELEAA